VKKTVKAKKPATVLVLRTTDADGKSYGGFQWPEKGAVACKDWNPKPECGNGLHGLLWGAGAGDLLDWSEDTRWLVVEVLASEVVKIDDQKIKFPHGTVVFCGKRDDAVRMVAERAPAGTIGVAGTATAGYRGTATAGEAGTATAGYAGTATAGDRGTATAGYAGTATAGEAGTATAGDRGTATAGEAGTATAGEAGTATAGYRGTATAGEAGILTLRWWDGKRYRIGVFYVGEDGVLPNTKYKLGERGKLVKVTP